MSFSGGPAGVDTEHLWHLIGGVLVGERNRPDWLFSSANQCTRIETTEASETAFHCCVYEFTHLVYFLLIANVVCLDKSTLLPPGGMERYFLLAQLSRLKSLRCIQVQFFCMPESGSVCEGECLRNVLWTTKLHPTFF